MTDNAEARTETEEPTRTNSDPDLSAITADRRTVLEAVGLAGLAALAGSGTAAAQEATVPTAGKAITNSSQEIPAGDQWTDLQYDTAAFSTGSFDVENDYFVAPEDGLYAVTVTNEVDELPDGARCHSAIAVNGDRVVAETVTGTAGLDVSTVVSAVVSLSKGARVKSQMRHSADAPLSLDSGPQKANLAVVRTSPGTGGGLRRESEHSVPGDESWTPVEFDTAAFDTGDIVDTEDGTLAAPSDGLYVLGATVRFDSAGDGSRYTGGITVNGDAGDSVVASETSLGSSDGAVVSAHATTVEQLSEGDEIGATVRQNGGESATIGTSGAGTALFAARLGDVDGQPAVRAYLSGDPDTALANSWYPPKWDAASFTSGGIEVTQPGSAGETPDGEPGYITLSEAGYYLIGMNVEVNDVPDRARIVTQLRNGTGYQDGIARNGTVGVDGNTFSNHVATVEQVQEGDTIGATVWTDKPGDFTLNGGETTSYVYAVKLGNVPEGPTATLTPMPTPADPTPTPTETATQNTGGPSGDTPTETTGSSGPGFGMVAALSGLGTLGAARAVRNRLTDEEE